MAQDAPPSSPLSSPPSSLQDPFTPRGSPSPPEHSPEASPKNGPAIPSSPVPSAPIGTEESMIATQPSTPPEATLPEKRSPSPSKKRAREDDDEEGSPPQKVANSKIARGKKANAPKKAAAKKTAPRPQPASSRPSRNRKAPERFEDLQEVTPVKAPVAKKAPAGSRVFDPIYITTNSTSRLVKADVYHMLLEPEAWTSLSADQQLELLSMLPKDDAIDALIEKVKSGDTINTRPAFVRASNDCFRTDVAKFQEDLKNGYLAKTWQAAAEQAVKERAAGEYDDWKAEESEQWWGQKANPPGI